MFKRCPKCHSQNLTADVISINELDWICKDCGYGWYEDYGLDEQQQKDEPKQNER